MGNMARDEFFLLAWVLIILILGAMIICIALVRYFTNRAKHKERMLMIEKGITPPYGSINPSQFPWQKIGIVIIGISIGLVIISILASMGALRDNSTTAVPLAVLGICGGLSMVVANRFDNNQRNP